MDNKTKAILKGFLAAMIVMTIGQAIEYGTGWKIDFIVGYATCFAYFTTFLHFKDKYEDVKKIEKVEENNEDNFFI